MFGQPRAIRHRRLLAARLKAEANGQFWPVNTGFLLLCVGASAIALLACSWWLALGFLGILELGSWNTSLGPSVFQRVQTSPSGRILLLFFSLAESIRERGRPSEDLFKEWVSYSTGAEQRLKRAQGKIIFLRSHLPNLDGPLGEVDGRISKLLDRKRTFASAQTEETSWTEILESRSRDRDLRQYHLFQWAREAETLLKPIEEFVDAVGTVPPVEPLGHAFGSSGKDEVRFWADSAEWKSAVICLRRQLPKQRRHRLRLRFRWLLPSHHHV